MIPLDNLKDLDLKEGDLIEICYKEKNNTTHTSFPAYFRMLNFDNEEITYSKKIHCTGGIVGFYETQNTKISKIENLTKIKKERTVSKPLLSIRD